MHPNLDQDSAASHPAPGLRITADGRESKNADTAQRWSAQYEAGAWDYLESEDEAAHYLAICALYRRHCPEGTLLDVGCGIGTLYRYLGEQGVADPALYTGIDFAQEAVLQAGQRFPGVRLACCDYSGESISQRFDCVVFNETLYYFQDPLAILQKCVMENLGGRSVILASMYGEHHEPLWQSIAAGFRTLDEQVVENRRQMRWKIRALQPLNV